MREPKAKRVQLDARRMHHALNRKRVGEGLSWRQVAAAACVTPSTLTRMSQGHRPSATGYVRLLAWLEPPLVMGIDFITGWPNAR